jgi:hypothetical protein
VQGPEFPTPILSKKKKEEKKKRSEGNPLKTSQL